VLCSEDSMKLSPGRRQIPSKLSASAHKRLNMYALAAGAAAAGALTSAQPTEAKIVYTPANIRIGQGVTIQLDLNHDGVPDFTVWNTYHNFTTFTAAAILGATPSHPGNEVVCTANAWAAALPKNVRIASTGAFRTGSRSMALIGHDYNRLYGGGPWAGDTRAYLGLKFQIGGKAHYGWARLAVIARPTGPMRYPLIDVTLTGYAFETIPNKAIITGKTMGRDEISIVEPDAALTIPTRKPASLGLLARGAPGFSIWRREQSADTLP